MSRAYGWRASCPAGGVTVVGVGSGDWLAQFIFDVQTRRQVLVKRDEIDLPSVFESLRDHAEWIKCKMNRF
jgi:hypothetical protein